MVVPTGVIIALGGLFTATTVAADVDEQLLVLVTKTVYEPAEDAVKLAVVSPLMFDPFNFHWYDKPVPVFAVNETLPPLQKDADPAGDIDATGRLLTVTTVAADVAEQLLVLVTTTVYEPAEDAVKLAVVSPLIFEPFNFHWYDKPVPVFAVNETLPPLQKDADPAGDIDATGRLLTVTTVAADVAEQLLVLVTTTVYEPAEDAVKLAVVAPLMFDPFNFHWYDKPDPVFAFNTTFPPEQKVVKPTGVMVALGG